MSHQILIACETLLNEITLIKEKLNNSIQTVWMDNTLHAYPERLNKALQEKITEIDSQDRYQEILFAYSNCGNALLNLCSQKAKLVIPKYADCIGLLLNHLDHLDRLRTNTYFLTKGWLDGKKGLEWEIQYNKERFGEKRAKQIIEMMYQHYHQLMLIDTGAYDIPPAMERTEKIAQELDMEPVLQKGDISPLEKLLTGQWDDHFCIKKPGEITSYKDFE